MSRITTTYQLLLIALLLPFSLRGAEPSVVVSPLRVDSAAVRGCGVGSLLPRDVENALVGRNLASASWSNPSLHQFRSRHTESEVGAGYSFRRDSEPLDVQLGSRDDVAFFRATTYMKHRSSTLWGAASYHNGSTRDICWNETSDLAVVRPYVMGDSIFGRMSREIYHFMGGYADQSARYVWGAELSYTAGLHYSSVDPRPRNVTSLLEANAGAGLKFNGIYAVAAALSFAKYKQTNDISFYSELGRDKIFHLVGFANDYSRFAGTGEQTYYNGYYYGASLNLAPQYGEGFTASVGWKGFTATNVVTQLNKLPLSKIREHRFDSEAGWKGYNACRGDYWTLQSSFVVLRRVGTENIFGDPSASVYEQIGSLDMTHENRVSMRVDGVWERVFAGGRLVALHPHTRYEHFNLIYSDPQCRELLNSVSAGLEARGQLPAGRLTRLTTTAEWCLTVPTSSLLSMSDVKAELAGLQRACEQRHDLLAHTHHSTSVGIDALIGLGQSHKYSLQAGVKWHCEVYADGVSRNELTAAVGVVF